MGDGASFQEGIFRDRMDPPRGEAFGWAYLSDPVAAAESVALALDAWRLEGRPFFRRFAHYPESFRALVVECDASALHGRTTLTYGRIALHLGIRERAAQLAEAGLAEAPEAATLLRRDLEKLLEQCRAA